MRFLLAGQPNSGKSTIFNAVAGYRSATANFPGSSITFTISRALIFDREVEVVDLPGTYSLTSTDEVGGDAQRYLLDEPYDLIIDVVDASRLGRSLELTLQLLELGRPVVVALNMVDEARRHGLDIDVDDLSRQLGVPVVPCVARTGRGLRRLFRTALETVSTGTTAKRAEYDRGVETALDSVSAALEETGAAQQLPVRFVAGKLLERDAFIESRIYGAAPGLKRRVFSVITRLQRMHGWSADQVVSGNRHAVAHAVEERAVIAGPPQLGWREWADQVMLHPLTGGPLMVAILGGLFWIVFGVGQRLEEPLIESFETISTAIGRHIPPETVLGTVVDGVVTGLAGGVAIVLPYLLPFLLGLAVLEDTGYLPRIAYILDSFMHRIGLHGKSVLPLVLGYGCTVPAIMAARILESPRDRRITAVLASFIPCSARTVVIFGLVAAYMGPLWALFVYLLNLVFVVGLGAFLARRMKGRAPGLILEIPDLSLPSGRTLIAKTWLSLKEFIVIAWPVLIVASVVLGLLDLIGAERVLNAGLAPLTVGLLGLPAAVGMTLVFGVLRKELTLVMLVQALGTAQVGQVLSDGQLMTLTLFVVFYVPCLATVAVIGRQMGWRDAAWVSALTLGVAIAIGVASRAVFALVGA